MCGGETRKQNLTRTTANMKQNNSGGSCFDAFSAWRGEDTDKKKKKKRFLNFAKRAEETGRYRFKTKPA